MYIFLSSESKFTENPNKHWLEERLYKEDYSYWNQGGNGETILFKNLPSYKIWIKSTIIFKSKNRTYRVDPFIPWVVMQQPEEGLFFILVGEMTPCLGEAVDCEDLAIGERGGNPVPIPRACLTNKDDTLNILSAYINGVPLNNNYTWVKYSSLPIDWGKFY